MVLGLVLIVPLYMKHKSSSSFLRFKETEWLDEKKRKENMSFFPSLFEDLRSPV